MDIDDDEGSSPGIESDGRLLFLTNHFLDLLMFGHCECLRRLITWCGIYDGKGNEEDIRPLPREIVVWRIVTLNLFAKVTCDSYL